MLPCVQLSSSSTDHSITYLPMRAVVQHEKQPDYRPYISGLKAWGNANFAFYLQALKHKPETSQGHAGSNRIYWKTEYCNGNYHVFPGQSWRDPRLELGLQSWAEHIRNRAVSHTVQFEPPGQGWGSELTACHRPKIIITIIIIIPAQNYGTLE